MQIFYDISNLVSDFALKTEGYLEIHLWWMKLIFTCHWRMTIIRLNYLVFGAL